MLKQNDKQGNKAGQPETGNEIVNIRVPKDLILDIDFLVKKRVFNSRSEAIREFAREYVHSQVHVLEKNAKNSGRGGRGW